MYFCTDQEHYIMTPQNSTTAPFFLFSFGPSNTQCTCENLNTKFVLSNFATTGLDLHFEMAVNFPQDSLTWQGVLVSYQLVHLQAFPRQRSTLWTPHQDYDFWQRHFPLHIISSTVWLLTWRNAFIASISAAVANTHRSALKAFPGSASSTMVPPGAEEGKFTPKL